MIPFIVCYFVKKGVGASNILILVVTKMNMVQAIIYKNFSFFPNNNDNRPILTLKNSLYISLTFEESFKDLVTLKK